jgi:hypothetical protein
MLTFTEKHATAYPSTNELAKRRIAEIEQIINGAFLPENQLHQDESLLHMHKKTCDETHKNDLKTV